MLTVSQRAMDVQQASEQLLQQARQALGGMDQYFRDQGLDPDQVRNMMSTLSTAEIDVEAREKFEQIKHDIEREVDQKRVELGLAPAAGASSGVKRQRSMV